jgi:hypothetical protein
MRGGKRQGAGRKSRAEEMKSAEIAQRAMVNRYGTLEKAMVGMLDSQEPSLIKFVAEHAFGKPIDNLNLNADGVGGVILFELPKNGRELAEEAIKNANGNGNGHHEN